MNPILDALKATYNFFSGDAILLAAAALAFILTAVLVQRRARAERAGRRALHRLHRRRPRHNAGARATREVTSVDASVLIVVVIALGTMLAVPIMVWRENRHYPQLRHARLKWAAVIACAEAWGIAFLSNEVKHTISSVGLVSTSLENLSIGCMLLAFFLFVWPVNFLLIELRPYREARRKARKLARQAARRQQQNNTTGEVEV